MTSKNSTRNKQNLLANFPQLKTSNLPDNSIIAMPISMFNTYSPEKIEIIITGLKKLYPNCHISLISTGLLYRHNHLLKYIFNNVPEEAINSAILDGKKEDETWNLSIDSLKDFLRKNSCKIVNWQHWIGEDPNITHEIYQQLQGKFDENSQNYSSVTTSSGCEKNSSLKYQEKYFILKNIIEQQGLKLEASTKNYIIYKKIVTDEFENNETFATEIKTASLKFLTNLISNKENRFFTEQQKKLIHNQNTDLAKNICGQFLLEEFAVTLCWIREGFAAMVYSINANPILNSFNEYLFKLYGNEFIISDIKFEQSKNRGCLQLVNINERRGNRGKICANSRRIASYLTRICADFYRLYSFCSILTNCKQLLI